MAPKVLSGFIDDGRGEPLADIPAVATILGTSTVVDTTITDDDGHWSFSGLPTADEYLVTLTDTSGNSVSRAPWSGELREAWVRDRLDVAGLPVALDPAAGNALTWTATGLYAASGMTQAAADLRYEPIDTMYTKTESDARYPQKTDVDPYPNYLTSTEADALFLTPAEGNAAYAALAHNHDTTYVQLTGGSVMTGLLGPSTHNTRDLGTTGTRWRALYGMTGDLTTSLTVASKAVAISATAGNSLSWNADGFYSNAINQATGDTAYVNAGGDTMVGDLNMTANVLPTVTNVRSLGSTSLRWLKVWATDADFTNAPTVGGSALLTATSADALFLTPAEGNTAYATAAHNHDTTYVQLTGGSVMTGLLGPTTTNTRDLGTTALRWRKLWAVDAEFTNAPTVGGVAVLTATSAGLLYEPLDSAYTKSEDDARFVNLAGGSVMTGLLGPTSTNTRDLGTSALRWRALYGVTGDLSSTLGVGGLLTASAGLAVTGAATVSTTLSVNSRPVIMAGCRVYHNANQTITTGTLTALAFNTERYDTDLYHDTVTLNTRLTVPTGMAGKYAITGGIEWAAVADATFRVIGIRLNGTTQIGRQGGPNLNSATVTTLQNVSTIYDLAVGDYVELMVRHERGSNLDVIASGNYSPEFGMQRIG